MHTNKTYIILGVYHESFKSCCIARGLLKNDEEWVRCLSESSAIYSASKMRYLFCIILIHCEPSNPIALWDKFKPVMSEDILHCLRQQYAKDNPNLSIHVVNDNIKLNEKIFNDVLWKIQDILCIQNKNLTDYGIPLPSTERIYIQPQEIRIELNYNADICRNFAKTNLSVMNTDQRYAFDTIINSINGNTNKTMFFIDAPGK